MLHWILSPIAGIPMMLLLSGLVVFHYINWLGILLILMSYGIVTCLFFFILIELDRRIESKKVEPEGVKE